MGIDEVMKSVVVKLKDSASAIENFGTNLAMANDWVEASREKIHTATPFAAAAVVLVVVCICGCCCCGVGGGGGKAKTMKAPGRNRRMSRREFERDPKGYFAGLRSHSD